MGNHDRSRIATRLGTNRVDSINMILGSLPGASVTYNGDEIGMTDVWISWEQTVDPQGCNTNPQVYESVSRDPARTPLQWDSSTSAGFSTNPNTWLPVATDYRSCNIANQMAATNSPLKVFISLQKLRQSDTLKLGSTEVVVVNQNVVAIVRELPGNDTYITVVNLRDNQEVLDLSGVGRQKFKMLEYVVADSSGSHQIGDQVSRSGLTLRGYESAVFKNDGTFLALNILLWNFVLITSICGL
jgi:alpha-glucosidase